jgi:hypothetical protein
VFKTISLFVAYGLLSFAESAHADPMRLDLQIKAVVADASFYVEPQGGWPMAPVQISYDPTSERFSAHTMVLRVFNPTNNVAAALAYPATLFDDSSAEKLGLDILVAGKKLTTVPQDFHPRGPVERTHQLSISSSSIRPVSGTYHGAVSLVFDEVPAEEPSER